MIRELLQNKKVVLIGALTLIFFISIIIAAIIHVRGQSRSTHDNYVSDEREEPPFDSLSGNELQELLRRERAGIIAVIDSNLTIVDGQFAVDEIKLLGTGQYSVVRLRVEQRIPIDTFDGSAASLIDEEAYRIILGKNENNRWQLVATPKIVFSYAELPEIPRPVIRAANDL